MASRIERFYKQYGKEYHIHSKDNGEMKKDSQASCLKFGVVRWYDAHKNMFGVIAYLNGELYRDSFPRLQEQKFYEANLHPGYVPEDNDWVIFSLKRRDKKVLINDVTKFDYNNKQHLLQAFETLNEDGKFKGRTDWSNKRDAETYDEPVLRDIFSNAQNQLISEAICQFLEDTPSTDLLRWCLDDLVYQKLESLFLTEDVPVSEDSVGAHIVVESLTKIILTKEPTEWSKILEALRRGIDLTKYNDELYHRVNGTLLEAPTKEFKLFLKEFGTQNLAEIFQGKSVSDYRITQLLYQLFGDSFTSIFDKSISNRDEINFFLFLSTEEDGYLEEIQDWQHLINNLETQAPELLFDFIKLFLPLIDVNENPILPLFSVESLAKAIKTADIDTQKQIIHSFSEPVQLELVTSYFEDTEVFDAIIGELWKNKKSAVSYLVFDLESKDQENIDEFAFYADGGIYPDYKDEEQLKKVLKRRFNSVEIVVGHNIKQWDLPILKEKGITVPENTFIWDTLEIELLLNPCRYSYSLKAKHEAQYDTELTNGLFWNQLYRLSKKRQLCVELKDFLPDSLNQILADLQKPYFKTIFKKEVKSEKQFLNGLLPLSAELNEQLRAISSIPKNEKALVIAPKLLWPRIAKEVSLQFPQSSDFQFLAVDKSKIKNLHTNDFIKAYLLRFCKTSKSSITANIPSYMRIESQDGDKAVINDAILNEIWMESESNVDCIDVNLFEDKEIRNNNYKHIFIIGTEIYDRVHKTQLGRFTFADLIQNESKLIMHNSASYALLTDAELETLDLKKSKYAANVWIEKDVDGGFTVYQNYEYGAYRKAFLAHFKKLKPIYIQWKLEGEIDENNFTPVSSKESKNFNSRDHRIKANSTDRPAYWVYQWKLLDKIRLKNKELPIIYVVNNQSEYESLCNYARSRKYFVPAKGTSFRKLEYISNRPKSLIIINKQEFIEEIGWLRTDKPYCFIWDNMDIDRYLLVWNKLPFKGDWIHRDEDGIDYENKGPVTAQQCIEGALPIFRYYFSLVLANNEKSKFYVIDPYFDDYTIFHKETVSLWENENSYSSALNKAKKYFINNILLEPEIDTDAAIATIQNALIDGKPLSGDQMEIMPKILKKEADYIISMPTGGGKSVLFQGPAFYRAAFSRKLSIVISPLRALIKDQVEGLHEKGLITNVDYLSGDRSMIETRQIYRRIRSGEVALLYITPERFRVKSFINLLHQRMEKDGGLEYIVFDEAHCISQWGMEFRPDYRNAIKRCVELKKRYDTRILLFSATITAQVENDLKHFLPDVQRIGQTSEDYNPIRNHIGISFRYTEHQDEVRLEKIVSYIKENSIDFSKSCMLVFCRTRSQCEETAVELTKKLTEYDGHIEYYHAGLGAEARNDVYERMFPEYKDKNSKIYILCATKAFGMGMDIPNIHYLVHHSPPSVLEDYLQEVGRAGRNDESYKSVFHNGKQIPALCLVSDEDFKKLKDLLIKSQLSWSDLTLAKSSVCDFIQRFQSLQTTKKKPVVVPFDLWRKDDEDLENNVLFRLALHWLEHMKFLELGFHMPAFFDLELLPIDYNGNNSTLTAVFNFLKKKIESPNIATLVSIQEIRDNLHLPIKVIMDSLLSFSKEGVLKVNDTMRCKFTNRRFAESMYMLQNDKNNIFALHIAFEGVRSILNSCKVNRERVIDQIEFGEICKHLLDNVNYDLVEEVKHHKDGTKVAIKYMPWKGMDIQFPDGAVTKAETFKKDIETRIGRKMFGILHYIPGIKYSIQTAADKTIQRVITIKKKGWQDYIDELEQDCLKWLKYISDQHEGFLWTEALMQVNLEGKGFSYFNNLLSVLKLLSYIDYTPIMRTGIEVITTDLTENVIKDEPKEGTLTYEFQEEFKEYEKVKKVRLAAINIFSLLDGNEQKDEFIKRYFLCGTYDEYFQLVDEFVPPQKEDILRELTEEALRVEEEKMKGNAEQWSIYMQPLDSHINVLAGPGSGKTHVLTMRCARMIYREHVNPNHILLLAYNRAVVIELRNRINSLFSRLGMSRIGHQLNIYTFHAFAKRCLATRLDNIDTDQWEGRFLNYLKNDQIEFKALFPQIKYILIDEFQDITETRLESLFRINNIFPDSRFFTIGDINQSIYGFDRMPKQQKKHFSSEKYAAMLSPQPYYDRLYNRLHPVQLEMFINYRSYQKILDRAREFVPEGYSLPKSAESLMAHEPQTEYTFITDNVANPKKAWFKDLDQLIKWAKAENETKTVSRQINTIAVFFRTNNEVYRGYFNIRQIVPDDVKIRIQGASAGELWREREVYYLIQTLRKNQRQVIEQNNNKTLNGIKRFLTKKMEDAPHWDSFLLDVAFTLVIDYMESIRSDRRSHTWGELIDYLKGAAGNDDGGQVYKIYDKYKGQRILNEDKLTIVLTTMHKVKGLEFDAVVITPSYADLPLVRHKAVDGITESDLADMEEERRLLFVAYTRAKKYLYVYQGAREKALDHNELYSFKNAKALGYSEKETKLENYYLGYNARSYSFQNNLLIANNVQKNDPIEILVEQNGSLKTVFNIVHRTGIIGQLSQKSRLRQEMEKNEISRLTGLFVSEIFVWEYSDSVNSDTKNKTNFSQNWCEAARKQGYVYVINIAGFGSEG